MEFDLKKHGFWLILGGLVAVYVVIGVVVILPMSSARETSIQQAQAYSQELIGTVATFADDLDLPVSERVENAEKYARELKLELERTVRNLVAREKEFEEIKIGGDQVQTAIDEYLKDPGRRQSLKTAGTRLDSFMNDHFKEVGTVLRGGDADPEGVAAAAKRVFAGKIDYRLLEEQGREREMKQYVGGLIGEGETLEDAEDLENLRKRFVISKTFLEILGRTKTQKLGKIEVRSRRGEGEKSVGLDPDLRDNPYFESRAAEAAGSQAKYAGAFLVHFEVSIRFEDVPDLLSAILDGKAAIKVGWPDESKEVQLTTDLESVQIVKESHDPVFPGKIPVEPGEDQRVALEKKRAEIAKLLEPVMVYVDVYVLDFESEAEALKLLEPPVAAEGTF